MLIEAALLYPDDRAPFLVRRDAEPSEDGGDFGFDFGGGDKLGPNSRAALEEMAATLRANPKIQTVSIAIGTKGAKPAVSDKRAQEILAILRGGSLDSARYEVVLQSDIRSGLVQVQVRK